MAERERFAVTRQFPPRDCPEAEAEAYILTEPIAEPDSYKYGGVDSDLLVVGPTGVCAISTVWQDDDSAEHSLVFMSSRSRFTSNHVKWWSEPGGPPSVLLGSERPKTLALSADGFIVAVAINSTDGTTCRVRMFLLTEPLQELGTGAELEHQVQWIGWSKFSEPSKGHRLLAVGGKAATLVAVAKNGATSASGVQWQTRPLKRFDGECRAADWSPDKDRIAFAVMGPAAVDLDEADDEVEEFMSGPGRVMVVDAGTGQELYRVGASEDDGRAVGADDLNYTLLDWVDSHTLIGITVRGTVGVCRIGSSEGAARGFKLSVASEQAAILRDSFGQIQGFRRSYVAYLPSPLNLLVVGSSDVSKMMAVDLECLDNEVGGWCEYLQKDYMMDALANDKLIGTGDDGEDEYTSLEESVQGMGVLMVATEASKTSGGDVCPMLIALGSGGTVFTMLLRDKLNSSQHRVLRDVPPACTGFPNWLSRQLSGQTSTPERQPAPSAGSAARTTAPPPPGSSRDGSGGDEKRQESEGGRAASAGGSTAAPAPTTTSASRVFRGTGPTVPNAPSSSFSLGTGSSGGGSFSNPSTASFGTAAPSTAGSSTFSFSGPANTSTSFGGPSSTASPAPAPFSFSAPGTSGFGSSTFSTTTSSSLGGQPTAQAPPPPRPPGTSVAPPLPPATSSSGLTAASSSSSSRAPSGFGSQFSSSSTGFGAQSSAGFGGQQPALSFGGPGPVASAPAPPPAPASRAPPAAPAPAPAPPQPVYELPPLTDPVSEQWKQLLPMAELADQPGLELRSDDLQAAEAEVRRVGDAVQSVLDDIILYQDEVERLERHVRKLGEKHLALGRQARDYRSIVAEVKDDEVGQEGEAAAPATRRRVDFPAGTATSWLTFTEELEELDRLLSKMDVMESEKQRQQHRAAALGGSGGTPGRLETRRDRMARELGGSRGAAGSDAGRSGGAGGVKKLNPHLRTLQRDVSALHVELRKLEGMRKHELDELMTRGKMQGGGEQYWGGGDGGGLMPFRTIDEDNDFAHPSMRPIGADALAERVRQLRLLARLIDSDGGGAPPAPLVVSNEEAKLRAVEEQKREAARREAKDRKARMAAASRAPADPRRALAAAPAPSQPTTTAPASRAAPAPAPATRAPQQSAWAGASATPATTTTAARAPAAPTAAAPAPATTAPPPAPPATSTAGSTGSSFSFGTSAAPAFGTALGGAGAKPTSSSLFSFPPQAAPAPKPPATTAPDASSQAKPSAQPTDSSAAKADTSSSSSAAKPSSSFSFGPSTTAFAGLSALSTAASAGATSTSTAPATAPAKATAPEPAPAPAAAKPASSSSSAAFPPMATRAPRPFMQGGGATAATTSSGAKPSAPPAAPPPPMPTMAPRKASDLMSQAMAKPLAPSPAPAPPPVALSSIFHHHHPRPGLVRHQHHHDGRQPLHDLLSQAVALHAVRALLRRRLHHHRRRRAFHRLRRPHPGRRCQAGHRHVILRRHRDHGC